MSAEEVTVSLSRLALAKAIKTPDAGEDEAEPWTKSIIFHQAHIDSDMRNSIISPQQNRRRPGQRQQPLLHKNQKQQRGHYPPNMHHSRQDELHQQRQSRYNNLQQYPNQQQQQQQQQQHIAQINPKTNGNKGYPNSTVSKSAGTKSGRHIIPSDDEDDEEDDDEEEEEEDEDEDEEDEKEEAQTVIKNIKKTPQNNTLVQARKMSEADSKHQVDVTQQAKVKRKNHRQQPSDDEEEEEDESDKESENDENDNESDRDSLDNGHEATNALAAEENQKTYARRMSTLRQLEKGSGNPRRRSRSLSDMEQFTLPLAQIGEHDLSLGELNTMDEWQKTMADVENLTGSSMSDLGSSAMTSNEGDVIEEPVVSTNTSPSQQKANYRMSTLGEMDFYQYQQQQQQIAFHNMQMQQAMQMAQIQQYQQAMQMQQQMAMNYDSRKANNRQSAMDVMLQMEQDKSRKHKKKPINPSNANLNDGLLGRVPEQRQHNMSFQGQMMSKRTTMARKSDHNLRESRNRPPSTMNYDNARAGSSMGMYSQMGRSESPMPTVSMSTPLQPMVGQYLSPNRPRTRQQPMMAQSRSTGRSSYMPSSRQSTQWGTKSKERIR